jgi:hypothetical protein
MRSRTMLVQYAFVIMDIINESTAAIRGHVNDAIKDTSQWMQEFAVQRAILGNIPRRASNVRSVLLVMSQTKPLVPTIVCLVVVTRSPPAAIGVRNVILIRLQTLNILSVLFAVLVTNQLRQQPEQQVVCHAA